LTDPLCAVNLVVDFIIALLPKVTDHSEEMKNILLEFSREVVTIHPEPFLTDIGHRQLLQAFSNSLMVSLIIQIQVSCR
jgi:hypothetical protein